MEPLFASQKLNKFFTSTFVKPVLLSLVFSTLVACQRSESPNVFSGYIEGEFVYAVTPQAGFINGLFVKEGDSLILGQAVASLGQELQNLQIKQTTKELNSQGYQLKDMSQGARAEEIAVVEDQIAVVKEQLVLVNKNINRTNELISKKLTSQNALDVLETEREVLKKTLLNHQHQIEVLKLPAREFSTRSQQENYGALAAKLEQQQWLKNQRHLVAPATGSVDEVFYQQHEYVQAGAPVLSILKDDIKLVRFAVPQRALAAFKLGQQVMVHQDGLAKPVTATVSFISKKAEFTPPVLYGPRVRDKLIFMLEAQLELEFENKQASGRLNIGQPVDVYAQ